MKKTRLGRTNLYVSRSSFGCLPIQRNNFAEAIVLLRKAYHSGINFYDTARVYTDSEAKIGEALADVRSEIIIASKSRANDRIGVLNDLEESLHHLKTGYLDLLQLHNPDPLPDPNDSESPYQGLLEARKKGFVRFIGITCHKRTNAEEAVRSGLYDTLQYPLSSISSQQELALINHCREHDVGLIAMKALAGGLINSVPAVYAFLSQYENVVPIWGINEEWQLDEFISLENDPPVMDRELLAQLERDREELSGAFCRGCGYCLPCPADIPIPTAARISGFLKRSPYQRFLQEEFKEEMDRIEDCIQCNHCKENCPYELDTPDLLKEMLFEYRLFYKKIKGV